MGAPEGSVETYLKRRVARAGGLSLKFVSPGVSGVPDQVCIFPEHVLFVEVKRDGGKPRKLQELVQGRMRAAGADVRTVAGRTEVDALMDDLAREYGITDESRQET